MATVKGLAPSEKQFDGSPLRIAIVHARWNKEVIDTHVSGCISTLKSMGVKESNNVIQSVPGSFEPKATRCNQKAVDFTRVRV